MTDVATIHLAGPFDPDLGQLCTHCGYLLSRSNRGAAWVTDGEGPPSGWPEGAEVLVQGPAHLLASALIDRDENDEQPCI